MSGSKPASQAPARDALRLPGIYPCGLTWDGRYLWHSDQEAKRIWALDPCGGYVVREHPCEAVRADLAYDGAWLAQIGGRPKRLVLVDPERGAHACEVEIQPASGRATGAEFCPDGLWLLLRNPSVVQLRKYPSMTVEREHRVPISAPSGLTWCDGVLVCGDFGAGVLHAIDAASGRRLAWRPVTGQPTGMTFDGERIWYCDFPGRALRAVERFG